MDDEIGSIIGQILVISGQHTMEMCIPMYFVDLISGKISTIHEVMELSMLRYFMIPIMVDIMLIQITGAI